MLLLLSSLSTIVVHSKKSVEGTDTLQREYKGRRPRGHTQPISSALLTLRMLTYLLALAVPAVVLAQFGGPPPNGQIPPLFPPHIEALIPADVLAQMKAIHENPSMPPQMKHEKIDDLMISLPSDLLDKIPPPPGFEQLPQDVQDTFKRLSRDRSVKWADRQAAIRRFIDSLPESVKSLIPMPGAGGPPGFEAIPIQQRAQIQMIENDQNMSFRDRYFKIKQIMDSLPAEIRAHLPAAPPPPPY